MALGMEQIAARDETRMEVGENILQLEDATNENNSTNNRNLFDEDVEIDSAESVNSLNEQENATSTRQMLPHVSFSQIDLDKFRGAPLNMDSITKKIIDECNSKELRYEPGSEAFDGEIFQQKGYYFESEAEHKPFSKWGFQHTRKIYHYIIFYYRTNDDEQPEMFAMTTGQAWQIIKKFADFNFPSKIAKRILSKEGMSKRTVMPLFGNKRKVEVDFEDPQLPDPLQPLYIPLFISRLRKDASILRLQRSFSASQLPFVTVGSQIIRFQQKFAVEHIEDIVDHLSQISRRKVTYTFEDGQETGKIETDAQGSNLAIVEKSVKFELDNDLQMRVLGWLSKGEFQPSWLGKEDDKVDLDNFYLCYKHFEDFNTACSFELRWKEKKEVTTIKHWDTRPKLMLVIAAIRESRQYKKFQKCHCPSKYREKFPAWFSKLRFGFTNERGLENPNQKLLQFIQGDMLGKKDGRIYWHLNNQWFHVMDDYLALVNCQFKKLIRDYLIEENSNEYLKIKYLNTKTAVKVRGVKRDFEGEYNKLYEDEDNFIVGDKLLVHKIEMFDLLFYDKENGRTFLYHVKEKFGQKTRDVASQIINSSLIISGLLHSGDTCEFDEFCQAIVEKHKEKLPQICANVNTFKDALKKAHFVYAFADPAEKRSFCHEMAKKDTLDQMEFEKELSKSKLDIQTMLRKGLGCGSSWAQITVAIIDKLKSCGYADPQSKITAKLILENATRFKDNNLNWLKGDTDTYDTNKKSALDAVFKILSQLYCTSYDSTLAKLELLRIPPKLIKHGFKFKICEIEVEKATGK